jgi:carbamoyl-phosphate synthase large subunit
LHERTDHEVVGVDMDPTAAGLHLADAGHTVPPASDDEWAETLCSLVTAHDVDAVVPTVDEELAVLASLSQALPADTPVVAPRPGVVDTALDKYRTYTRLEDTGHNVPRTWLATDRDAVDRSAFPLLVKPRRGRGSRGIQRVDDQSELLEHLDASDYDPEELLLQEFIDGAEFTTSVVATQSGRLLGIVPKEALEKDGSTVTGVTRRSPAVRAECKALAETLDPRGPINVQQMVAEDGTPYTIEINPRFSSTSCLTAAAGVDEFDLLVRDALGESVDAPDAFDDGLYIRRYRSHVFVPEGEFEQYS